MAKRPADLPAMILCGGQGTRLRDLGELVPKPMVPVGQHPLVWHVMKVFATYGVRRFILCLGYKKEAFLDYFLNYRSRTCDVTVRLDRPDQIRYHGGQDLDWEVTLADTGDRTMTGARVARAARHLREDDTEFFLTYGDGVADIDLEKLLDRHREGGRSLTVTAVNPAGRFGEIRLSGSRVDVFHEKPQTSEGLINGGFMVIDRSFVPRYLEDDPGLVLEEGPMRRAAADGEMSAHVHPGFWQCMDTAREHQLLTSLWESGRAPWTAGW